jgi:thiamine kinase-like enzyme
MDASHLRVRQLACWSSDLEIVDLAGGITNRNYIVTDGGKRYVVRLGGDIPEHHVMRFNEHAASRAAAAVGLSPRVHYSEADALVIKYIPSDSLKPADVQHHLPAILELILRCHRKLTLEIEGPALSYWIYHIIRDYLRVLEAKGHDADLSTLRQQADILEAQGSPYAMVYGHNDLLSANILNDGKRLWLIDWDYAGFNSPLFDLGGLASNNELSPEHEQWLLENYFERPVSDQLQRDYLAIKAASLLKETLWSMLSEHLSQIDFDYAAYSRMNLKRYHTAWQDAHNA